MARIVSLELDPEPSLIRVTVGTDPEITFVLLGDGEALDISAETIAFTVKDEPGGAVKVATQENGPGQHASPTAGRTTFTVSRDDLVLADPTVAETWQFEVRRILASGRELVWGKGRFIVATTVGTDDES